MSDEPIANAFRRWGYLQAELDDLGRLEPLPYPEIDAVDPAAAQRWRSIYCGSIGVEFMHMPDPERCGWIAEQMEAEPPQPNRRHILTRIAETELFEHFLHARYVGTKRYSLEGAAALIPLLDAVLGSAAERGVEVALIGMSHRGRLDVVAHIVGIPPAHLFTRFEDVDPRSVLGGGDVKYHLGATGTYTSAAGKEIRIHLVSNPSHLEAVDPIVAGRVRARQERIGDRTHSKVLAITLHGDAAFAGQGIAAETLNLANLHGFTIGGTVHVIVNNLIGFTTEPQALHSSRYSSDVAKRLAIPIFHLNGEDPDAVVRAGQMALEYRARFHSDVVLDLIGYRRYGHSEVEDPTTTQPLLYRRIQGRPRLWESYADQLGLKAAEREQLEREIRERFDRDLEAGRALDKKPMLRRLPAYWDGYCGGRYQPEYEVETAVDQERLIEIAVGITTPPPEFHVHPKIQKLLTERMSMVRGDRPIDWGMAEALAFGSLLWDGVLVRLAGQDSRRGTFNQRHAVLVDTENGTEWIPLRHVRPGQARFDVYDTVLSEAAALGFEYGFSRDYPDALVCWEAQFGDFANGAQVIIDQFVAAAEDKWELLSGLVMLLPHGYEGQGPEHSSARLERYLQLAGEDNIQVCQPSTAAQYFHLLRRQALRCWRKPLIVLTPKGMLRAPAAGSSSGDMTGGRFQNVLADPAPGAAQRILVCSGRIAHELAAERAKREAVGTAILRLEQLYPFPAAELRDQLHKLAGTRELVWVQDEPGNMGALSYVRPQLERFAGERRVKTVKRSDSASPATGSTKAHALEQEALLELAFARFD